MFKDYNKYLSTTLKVYLFVLLIVLIMKIVGLDYFGIYTDSPTINSINMFMEKFKLTDVWYSFTLLLYSYIMISIVCNKRGFKVFFSSLIITVLDIICILTIKNKMNNFSIAILDFFLIYYGCLIVSDDKVKSITKRVISCFVISVLFQLISLLTRNNGKMVLESDFVSYFILNLDYLLLMIIYYRVYFMKGDVKLCGMVEVGLSSLKKINLKQSLQKLQRNYQNNYSIYQRKPKEEKLTVIIYLILSLIWNTLTVALVLFVAFLNNTFIECIFILTSFWLSKTSFGQPFHFDSMLKCFIVSNLSYYFLNRITTPLGISILIPIFLGVGLSYVTSKFVKKTYKPLYRGMPKDVFEETILKVTEKDSIKYKICYEFYIDKISDLSLSFKYNYSVSGIRKIKDRINAKIKKLN